MKETKFTKGEWFYQESGLGGGLELTAESRQAKVEIATIDTDFFGEIGDEQQANAHLIAVAPEMYEEIERDIIELEEFIEDLKPNSHDHIFYVNKLKRKTILLAKARGEV